MIRKIIRVQLFLVVLVFLLVVLFSLSPQKFLKLAVLQSGATLAEHVELTLEKTFDAGALIESIPYERGRFTDVLPMRRYERAIKQGKGDCSNLAHGLAYWLVENRIDFAIVHLLRLPGFVQGKGHVALEAAMEIDGAEKAGILDLLEGGVLYDKNSLVSARDLLNETADEIIIRPYHPTRDSRSAYYEKQNLESTVIGVTPNDEQAEYFRFIESVYIDIGNRTLERYIFDGIALLVGVFPKIHVQQSDYAEIESEYGGAIFASKCALIIVRTMVLIAIVSILYGLAYQLRISKILRRGSAEV
ncbi:MAG: hypothetical protein AAF387_14860 [Pseudomonadota bacterium]